MAAGTEGERTPLEVVDEWHRRAWSECDLDAVDELVTEPFVRHGVNGTSKRTRAELKSDLRDYQKALGKPVIEVRDRVVDGDKVWSRTHMRGASVQTGRSRTVERLSLYRVENGRIAEVWTLTANDADWEH